MRFVIEFDPEQFKVVERALRHAWERAAWAAKTEAARHGEASKAKAESEAYETVWKHLIKSMGKETRWDESELTEMVKDEPE